jgi:hypothetical protein
MSFGRGRRASSDLRVSGEWVRNVVQDAERAAAAAERAAAAATEALNRSQQAAPNEAPKKKVWHLSACRFWGAHLSAWWGITLSNLLLGLFW